MYDPHPLHRWGVHAVLLEELGLEVAEREFDLRCPVKGRGFGERLILVELFDEGAQGQFVVVVRGGDDGPDDNLRPPLLAEGLTDRRVEVKTRGEEKAQRRSGHEYLPTRVSVERFFQRLLGVVSPVSVEGEDARLSELLTEEPED